MAKPEAALLFFIGDFLYWLDDDQESSELWDLWDSLFGIVSDGSEGSGGCGRVWCWLGIAVAVLAVVLALVWLCKNGYFEKKVPATEVVAPVAAEPEAVEPEVVVPAVAAGPRYHVIAGAFEIESNADKLVAKVGREYPALTPKKFVDARTGYNMVSIYDGATEREAYNVMNRYWEINPCLWVYKVEL